MKNILFCFIIIPCLLSCQSKQPSYELYQEVIQTVIEADSLDKNLGLDYHLDIVKIYQEIGDIDEKLTSRGPGFDEVEISYLLDGFKSKNRKNDSLYLNNQFNKKCYFIIDEKLYSQFNNPTNKSYSFSDLLFSFNLKNVYCKYSLSCGFGCIIEYRLFLKNNNGKWEIVQKEVENFDF